MFTFSLSAMVFIKRILLLWLLFATFHHVQAVTRYATAYNHFSSLALSDNAEITDGMLRVNNPWDQSVVMLDSATLSTPSFRYYARMQNTHAKEGKKYKVTDSNGNSRKIDSTEAGIIIKISDTDHWIASCSAINTSRFNDIMDNRMMKVALRHFVNGKIITEKDTAISQNVNLAGGFNVICADVTSDAITVSIGDNKLYPIVSEPLTTQVLNAKVGCFIGPGAEVNIERTVLSYNEENKNIINTAWTIDELDKHFAQSKDPYEGYWTYLDRDLEDKWLRLGGRYTIAIVATDNGYDLIYIDGAQVKKSLWHCGMLKGRLTNTIFPLNYNAMWIDATFQSFELDVYATFESDVILNIKFPVYQSQLRFSKVLE